MSENCCEYSVFSSLGFFCQENGEGGVEMKNWKEEGNGRGRSFSSYMGSKRKLVML